MSHLQSAYSVEHLHYTFYKAAELSIAHAKQQRENKGLYLVSAYVMMAFALEAYVNDMCSVTMPQNRWAEMQKRASTRAKLVAVSNLLSFSVEFNDFPFRELKNIFDIRNTLAHASRHVGTIDTSKVKGADFTMVESQISKVLRDDSSAVLALDAVFQMVAYLHERHPKKDSALHPFVAGAATYLMSVVMTPLKGD